MKPLRFTPVPLLRGRFVEVPFTGVELGENFTTPIVWYDSTDHTREIPMSRNTAFPSGPGVFMWPHFPFDITWDLTKHDAAYVTYVISLCSVDKDGHDLDALRLMSIIAPMRQEGGAYGAYVFHWGCGVYLKGVLSSFAVPGTLTMRGTVPPRFRFMVA